MHGKPTVEERNGTYASKATIHIVVGLFIFKPMEPCISNFTGILPKIPLTQVDFEYG